MSRYLIETTEVYRADSEKEAAELIAEAKADPMYQLSKYTTIKKERKAKGEVVDEWYRVSLIKRFDDEKEPTGDKKVIYQEGAF